MTIENGKREGWSLSRIMTAIGLVAAIFGAGENWHRLTTVEDDQAMTKARVSMFEADVNRDFVRQVELNPRLADLSNQIKTLTDEIKAMREEMYGRRGPYFERK